MLARIGGKTITIPDERVRDSQRHTAKPNRIDSGQEISGKMKQGSGQSGKQPNIQLVIEKHSGIARNRTELRNPQNPQAAKLSPYRSKLECSFARTLEFDRLAGIIKGWRYEPVRFILPGESNTYKIDFCVWGYEGESRPVFIEVKGRNKSDERSLVKQKTAAGLNPWAKFLLMKRIRGMWVEREIKA